MSVVDDPTRRNATCAPSGDQLGSKSRSAAAETAVVAPGALQSAESEPPPAEPVAYRRYVMPQAGEAAGAAPAGDSMLADYNDYLARLAAGEPAQPVRKENR